MNVEIRASEWQDVVELSTGNVGRGGLFIRSEKRTPEPGTRLTILLKLPDETNLEVQGEVMHAIGPDHAASIGGVAGFGVKFDDDNSADLSLLEAIAASYSGGENVYALDQVFTSLTALVADGQAVEETSAYQLITPKERDQSDEDISAEIPIDVDSPPPGPGANAAVYAVDIPLAPIVDSAELSPVEPDEARAPSPPPQEKAASESGAPVGGGLQHKARNSVQAPPGAIFGVDFGTTFSSIALVAGNELAMLADQEGNTIFPSTVCYPEEGPPLIGWSAREKVALLPATTIASPKRLIGRRYDDRRVEPFLASMAVRTSAGPDGRVLADIYGDPLTIPQIVAEIFRHVCSIGEQATESPVQDIVLSVPVAFDEERKAICVAAKMAGLNVVEILDEPVAAATAYGLGRGSELVAVYDFGGGTFDFTLLEIKEGRFKVLGEAGDAWLGGDDFDIAIAEHAADAFWKKTKVDVRQRQVEWQRLLFFCEAAKRRLSLQQEVALRAPGMAMTLKGPLHLEMSLSRSLLDEVCLPLVNRSIEAVAGCLELADVKPQDVDQVVMVGGVSRMPLVRKIAERYFEREIRLVVDPEHAVVIGNAIRARFLMLSRKKKAS